MPFIKQTPKTICNNVIAKRFYFDYLCMIAMNRYKWNVDLTINKRFLEYTLLFKSTGTFFHHDIGGHLFLPYTTIGNLNIYGEPIHYMIRGDNGRFFCKRNNLNSVICYDNPLRTNNVTYLDFYAEKLADIDQTAMVNIKAQKTPVLIVCDENQQLSMINAYRDFEGNSPVIKGTKNFNNFIDFQVLKTDAPYVADKLIIDKSKIWNEICTFLGVNNANTEKRERMNGEEVNANNGQVGLSLSFGLDTRKDAIDKYNDMMGTKFNVDENEKLKVDNMGGVTGWQNTPLN